jgi:glutathione S-transferase
MVPVLVTDDGEVIQDSRKIIAWAQANPAGPSDRPAGADAG